LEYDLPQHSKGKDGEGIKVREGKVREGAASFSVVHPPGQDQGTQTGTLCLGVGEGASESWRGILHPANQDATHPSWGCKQVPTIQ
jgi:hypothetical protein